MVVVGGEAKFDERLKMREEMGYYLEAFHSHTRTQRLRFGRFGVSGADYYFVMRIGKKDQRADRSGDASHVKVLRFFFLAGLSLADREEIIGVEREGLREVEGKAAKKCRIT